MLSFQKEKLIVLVGWPLAALLISLLLFNDAWLHPKLNELGPILFSSLLFTAAYWVLLRFSYKKAMHYFPTEHELWKRGVFLFVAFVATFFVVNLVVGPLTQRIFPKSCLEPSPVMVFVGSLVISALLLAVYEILGYQLKLQAAEVEASHLREKGISSQLEGLRSQVNPHFLFNTLNTLTYLIPEDSEKATRFVRQLSQVYRYFLEKQSDHLVPLSEELHFLDAYIFLMRERFGTHLDIRIQDDVRNAGSCYLVPCALQIIFENALKHNEISTSSPLFIEVFLEKADTACGRQLVVRNTLQLKKQTNPGTGNGLKNIRERYRLLGYPAVVSGVVDGFFVVKIPLIQA